MAFGSNDMFPEGISAADEEEGEGESVMDTLVRCVPGIWGMRAFCPACPDKPSLAQSNGCDCVTCRKGEPLPRLIIHLNDRHHWEREAIADWLDTLDFDLRIRPGEEPPSELRMDFSSYSYSPPVKWLDTYMSGGVVEKVSFTLEKSLPEPFTPGYGTLILGMPEVLNIFAESKNDEFALEAWEWEGGA